MSEPLIKITPNYLHYAEIIPALAGCNVLLLNLSLRSTDKMHSTLVRVQNVFGFFTTVAFCTALLTALSVLLIPQHPRASVELRNVQV